MRLIALDAGHGINTYPPSKGHDGFAEFTFNSAVVGYTKPLLEAHGFRTLLTQPLNGNDVPLRTRTNTANAAKADLLLSFHADANSNPTARGHWAFYWHTSAAGKRLADIWSEEMTQATGTKHRGNHPSKPGTWTNFHMVRETSMPAVLMEHAFMTNPPDMTLLKSDQFRRQCAEAAARAVCRYYNVQYKGGNADMNDKNPSAWAEASWKKAIASGLMNEGQGPRDALTREQLAVILDRLGLIK